MLAAVGNILGGVIDQIEFLFTQLVECRAEPVHIESAHVQLLLGQGSKSCDDSILLVVKLLVHVGHEVITGGIESGKAQIFADNVDPCRAVQGRFQQPFLGNISARQQGFQPPGVIPRSGGASGQQIAEIAPLAVVAAPAVIGAAVQRILTQRQKDPHEGLRTGKDMDSRNTRRIFRRRVATVQLGIKDNGKERIGSLSAQHLQRNLILAEGGILAKEVITDPADGVIREGLCRHHIALCGVNSAHGSHQFQSVLDHLRVHQVAVERPLIDQAAVAGVEINICTGACTVFLEDRRTLEEPVHGMDLADIWLDAKAFKISTGGLERPHIHIHKHRDSLFHPGAEF